MLMVSSALSSSLLSEDFEKEEIVEVVDVVLAAILEVEKS
jgi:hypothetical protein